MIAQAYVDAIGFCGPGADTSTALFDAMSDESSVGPEGWTPSPNMVAKRLARRLSNATLVAIAAAEQIAPALATDSAWVFASSSGEGETLKLILSALSQPDIMLQPLKFQNAVHNAAQGQFSIAAGATGPATSIAAFDNSVAAGLLKAAMQIRLEDIPCGLVAFDEPLPPPLHERRPYELTLAGALALSPQRSDASMARLSIRHGAGQNATDPSSLPAPREMLDSNNPVRFMMPLIATVIGRLESPIVLDLPGRTQLIIDVEVLADA